MSKNTLSIPPHTHILSIERIHARGGCVQWAIWVSTNEEELAKPHNERQGTYFLLTPDGIVERVTVNGNQEDVLLVME